MKKLIVMLLVSGMLLSGCQPAAPTIKDVSSDGENIISSEGVDPDPSRQEPVPEPVPMPDAPPATEPGALDLPQTLYTSDAGLSVELLTPAQYDMRLDIGRGGPRGYLQTDYFQLGEGGKYAYANRNGKIVTDFIYDYSDGYWIGDRIPVTLDGKQGMIGAGEGEKLIPCEYDTVWGISGSSLIEAWSGNNYYILNADGTRMHTLERGDDFIVLNGKTQVLLQNGMLRFLSLEDGSPIANFACEEVRVVSRRDAYNSNGNDILAVNCGGVWGLCDENGSFIVKPAYENIGYFYGDYADFTQNGKKGLLNYKGKVVFKAEWDDLIVYDNSISVCKEGLWGAAADIDSGKLSIEPIYDFIAGYGNYGYACFERGGKYGVIDKDGNEIIPAKYDGMVNTQSVLEKGYFLVDGDNGPSSAGIVDAGGKVIIPADYYIYWSEDDDPYTLVETPSGKWGFIDGKGQFVIDAQYDYADRFIQGKDLAFVEKDGKIQMIDRKGNVVLKTEFSDVIAYNPESMVCAMEYADAQGMRKCCLVKINLPG